MQAGGGAACLKPSWEMTPDWQGKGQTVLGLKGSSVRPSSHAAVHQQSAGTVHDGNKPAVMVGFGDEIRLLTCGTEA